MGASRIETEYNEINSKDGWMMAFQVIILQIILHKTNKLKKKKNKQTISSILLNNGTNRKCFKII